MSNLTVRLATSTALLGVLVGFYNLPAKAQGELTEAPVDANNLTSSFVMIPDHNSTTARQTAESYASPVIHKAVKAVKAEPLVKLANARYNTKNELEGDLVVTDFFAKNATANLEANHYSYCIVKGHVDAAAESLKRLEQMGWVQVGIFSGLEGEHLNFGDIAGILFYNKEQNLYNVVWHGTANNRQGWEMNAENALITAEQIRSETIQKLHNELLHTLRENKSFRHFFGRTNKTLDALKEYVKEAITTNLSVEKLEKRRETLKKLITDNLPKIANKVDANDRKSLLEKIDAVFAVKLEMLRMVEAERGLKFEGRAHRGYTLKVASALPEIVRLMKRHADTLDSEARKTARVATTGHSLGGAVTTIFGAAFKPNFEYIFGREFQTANNDIVIHALSSAPMGDNTFKSWTEKLVGLRNIVTMIVIEDKVTDAEFKRFIPDFVRMLVAKIPLIGRGAAGNLESEYAKHIGTLMIDSYNDVHARMEKHFPENVPAPYSPTRLVHKYLAAPHYGMKAKSDPIRFEPMLAAPLNGEDGYNVMLAKGFGLNNNAIGRPHSKILKQYYTDKAVAEGSPIMTLSAEMAESNSQAVPAL